jgi:hypothetical protein
MRRARAWFRDRVRISPSAVLAAFLAFAIPAAAITVFTPSNPGGDVNVPGLTPNWPAGTYTKSVATANTAPTAAVFTNPQTRMLLEPSGTLASYYVNMAPAPPDGQEACIFSTQAVTNLYWSPNTGQSMNNAITTLAANGSACYLYGASNATWDRSR